MATIPFRLRDIDGLVEIAYGINEDPVRWGFQLFWPDQAEYEATRGFPVLEARVRYAAEGYAAMLGWIQVVDYTVEGEETVWAAPDTGSRYLDVNTPYAAHGIEPVFFDAPAATDAQNMDFNARTFLVCTPDVVSKTVEPVCGFTWGFDIEDGIIKPRALEPARLGDWIETRRLLRFRLPSWTFGADYRDPPALVD